jgi:poly [ADP-ribose] polymerase
LFLGSTLSVYQDDAGLIWDATLVRSGQNKAVEVSRIQLLVHGKSQTFHTWDLQYEFGSSEETKSIGNAGTLDLAKRTFGSKFKSRSHLAWKDRHAIPNAEGWIFLETHHREAPIFTSKTNLLPAGVENVLKIIFTSGNLQKYLHLLHTHGRSFLVENKVDKKKLLVGIAVLGKLMDLTDPQLEPVYCSKARKRLCTIYESLILTNLSLSDTKDTVRQELESLDLLLKLRDAGEILEKESQSSSLAMSQISQVLGLAKMTPGIYPLCLSLSLFCFVLFYFSSEFRVLCKRKVQSMKLTFLTC